MDETIADCASKMRAIGLVPGDYGEHVLPVSNTSYLGCCCHKDLTNGRFEIECEGSLDKHRAKSVLFHELAHTLPGCQNHAKGFLAACKMTDEAYGTNNELERMHHYNREFFRETYQIAFRFTGGRGDQYGISSNDKGLLLPLYEIVSILADGKRAVRELTTGRTFRADLVEIRGLRYHAMWQLERMPNFLDLITKTSKNSRNQYFTDSSHRVIPIKTETGGSTVVIGNGGLNFETEGLGEDGFHMVRDPFTGQTFSAEAFEVSELSYRRRYLAYEAVMRAGIGGLPDTWMRCKGLKCKDSVTSLAALVESIWNVNDLVRNGATKSRLRGSLYTLDTRILDAAEKSRHDLEETLLFACQAFSGYAKHRGMATCSDAMRLVAGRL